MEELKIGTPDYIDLVIFLTWLEDKEITEEIELGADAKKDFTEVDEGGDVKNGVRVQVDQFDPVPVKKATEEIIGWQSKPPIKEMFKDHNFTSVGSGERLTKCSAPPDEILLW